MKDRNGYILVHNKDHHRAEKNGIVYEHILVAEQILGRELKDKEVVHHIDKNRSNNNPENLMIFATAGDHARFHKGFDIYQIDNVWYATVHSKICPICNKTFTVGSNDNLKRRKFCSYECARKSYLRTPFDLNIIINELYKENGNFTKVASKYNVSSSGLAKRLKINGLPNHSSDYKNKCSRGATVSATNL